MNDYFLDINFFCINSMKNRYCFFLLVFLSMKLFSQSTSREACNLNKPEREAWFSTLGFGMFIHWSIDVQYGYNISHSLRLASDDFIDRYFTELPKTFNPLEFTPSKWAKMAKMAGMKYMVFTTKHHNGFCMWNTETTSFNIMNTPFKRDILKEVLDAFRNEGIVVGLYFSPDDFWLLHKQGLPISRDNPSSFAVNNKELDAYDKRQLTELLTRYGDIDILFLDGNCAYGKSELAKLAWKINPDIIVTRGAMATPEQELPNKPIPSPWEACYTLSESWSYRPTNEVYKKASDAILKLVEVKAKGGNLLLNLAPDAEGVICKEQAAILNEVSAWRFINHELFENTKPYKKVRSDNGYFILQSISENDLYIVIPGKIPRGEWQIAFIENIHVSDNSKLSLLGQSEITNEFDFAKSIPMTVRNNNYGIELKYIFNQRIYNAFRVENRWSNPIVLKISGVK
jgi:alpha-L-fucosidase